MRAILHKLRGLIFGLALLALNQRDDANCSCAHAETHQSGEASGNSGNDAPEGAIARLGTRLHEAPADALVFSPDGKLLIGYTKLGVVFWDVATAHERRHRLSVPMPYGAPGFCISSDGKMLALSEYNSLEDEARVGLWDLESRNRIRTLSLPRGEGPLPRIDQMAFGKTGSQLAVSATNAGTVAVFDVTSGRIQATLGDGISVGNRFNRFAFAPDGQTVAIAVKSRGVELWDVATQQMIRSMRPANFPKSAVSAMTFAPDGKILAAAIDTGLVLYDTSTGKETARLEAGISQVTCLAFTESGKKLVACSLTGNAQCWDLSSRKQVYSINGRVVGGRAAAISPDGVTVALSTPHGGVLYWDLTTGRQRLAERTGHEAPVKGIQFSADGNKLVSVSDDGQVLSWSKGDLESARPWTQTPAKLEKLSVVALRPSNELFLRMHAGTTIHVEPRSPEISIADTLANRKRVIRTPGDETILSLAASPDERVLATGFWGPQPGVRLLEILTGEEIGRFKGSRERVMALAWSHDGRYLATGEHRIDPTLPTFTQTVRVVDTSTGLELAQFRGVESNVTTLCFSPDGAMLAAGLQDSSILIWELHKFFRQPRKSTAGEDLQIHWNALADKDAAKAYAAAWALIANPNNAVPFLKARLKPFDGAPIRRWVADLDAENFSVRRQAAKELAKANDQAEWAMRSALAANPTLEARIRLLALLKDVPEVPWPETRQTLRAIMVLERIGSAGAREILEALVQGEPGARTTNEAKESLKRLAQRGR